MFHICAGWKEGRKGGASRLRKDGLVGGRIESGAWKRGDMKTGRARWLVWHPGDEVERFGMDSGRLEKDLVYRKTEFIVFWHTKQQKSGERTESWPLFSMSWPLFSRIWESSAGKQHGCQTWRPDTEKAGFMRRDTKHHFRVGRLWWESAFTSEVRFAFIRRPSFWCHFLTSRYERFFPAKLEIRYEKNIRMDKKEKRKTFSRNDE